MVNIREDIFKQCSYFILRMFTIIKQLFCNFINNTNHIRRRILSLLTNIQTTSLQMINHFNHLSILQNISTTSLQMINHFNHLNNLLTWSAMILSCWDSYKQFTNSKQDVNQPFTRNYSLRYGMRCKQDD